MTVLKNNYFLICSLFSAFFYFYIAYFLERTSFYELLFLWSFLFVFFMYFIKNKQISFSNLIGISIVFRLIFLFSIPNLSQDFYRFIWDGRILFEGLNPYLSIPETFIEQGLTPIQDTVNLYDGMGKMNGSHFTNYPPINQLCFWIAALFGSNSIFTSIVVLKLLLIFADVGILYFGRKLLQNLNLPSRNIFLYVLNPFIIIEMTGNLHFESMMLFFLIWSLYLLQQRKWFFSAILLACSISVKLIPLLFLPLFFQYFTKNDTSFFSGFKKLTLFYFVVLGVFVALFLPFYTADLILNYINSVGLWFRNFEFNASFYYIFREIGYTFRGWNEIAIIGKIMPVLTLLFLLILTFFRKNNTFKKLIPALLFGLTFYYGMSTTIHPWYVATLVILSVFTKYRFAILWSFSIIFSYQVYSNFPWKENLWFVGLEYFLVFSYLFWEIYPFKSIDKKQHATN